MATTTKPVLETPHDAFPINGTDYIEYYVGNAKQASLYYRAAFGYQLVGYRGPETGVRDRASYLLEQGKIRLVLTSPIGPDGPVAEHVDRRHGARCDERPRADGGRRCARPRRHRRHRHLR